MSSDLRELHPALYPTAAAFVQWLRSLGLVVTVTSTYRSPAKQAALYRRYQEGRSGGLPALPPGRSLHEHRLAWDMVVHWPGNSPAEDKALLRPIGEVWKRYVGGEWGGDAPIGYDPVHFQFKRLLSHGARVK